jgi:cytochrome c oxidase subunit 2
MLPDLGLFADLSGIPLFPTAASSQAEQVDRLYFFISFVCIVMTVLIFALIIAFAYRYRRKANPRPTQIEGSTRLEVTWTVLPFLIMLIMFGWGAQIYFAAQEPPLNAMEIFVTGKQWMWKVQYPNGGREINELHVPTGQPIKLTMASEDVIHSFSIPAFRVRHDVMPGHYNTLSFTATKPGRYRIFCTEYCGNQHATMGGWVTVMTPQDYLTWAAGGSAQGTLAEVGQTLFQQHGCASCHLLEQQGRCPNLRGLYGKPVQLNDGTTVIADEAYLRESILEPNNKVAAAFQSDIMPNFKGQLTEEEVIQLIAYIKSLSPSTPSSQQGSQQLPVVIAPVAGGLPGNPQGK